MPTAKVNGVSLFYELAGRGDIPIVLVHGSWSSHHGWDQVVPHFGPSYRVLRYDRRGHSQTERPQGQGSVREDVADLATLIEHHGLAPAWVIANSFGASIALRLAIERPGILRGVIGHEPPLFALLDDNPDTAHLLEEEQRKIQSVVERIGAGDHAGAAEEFVERIALGPGSWTQLPAEIRETLIENAPTFLDEANDPESLRLDLARIGDFAGPVLLTEGGQSPPIFSPIVKKLAATISQTEVFTFPDAGHIPHVTHPEEYLEAVTAFVGKHRE